MRASEEGDSVAGAAQSEAYEKVLSANLTRVFDLLKFAEAKNAALLALSSAWIVGLVNLLSSGKPLPPGFKSAALAALASFIAASLIALCALLPKRRTDILSKGGVKAPNYLFFGDIAGQTVETCLLQLEARYRPSGKDKVTEQMLKDLCIQISLNSKIADRKYRLFNYGAAAVLVALMMFLFPTLILLFSIDLATFRL